MFADDIQRLSYFCRTLVERVYISYVYIRLCVYDDQYTLIYVIITRSSSGYSPNWKNGLKEVDPIENGWDL